MSPRSLAAWTAVSILCLGLCPRCPGAQESADGAQGKEVEMVVTSTAFEEGEAIPEVYTCDGRDISPPLSWEGVPGGTRSFGLICDDPDAPMGTWVHWVLYNIPADTTALPAGVPAGASLEDGSKQGISDFGRPGYGGPCPPGGKPHRYFFKLYALDTLLQIKGPVTKANLEKEMKGHVIAEARIMGTYTRK